MRTAVFLMWVTAVWRCVLAEPLAYWRLDVLPEGFDLSNAAGTNHILESRNGGLSASFRKPLAVVPEWEQLPESTRGGCCNNGSVFMEGAGSAFLCAPGLGPHLGLARSFTVEGWLRKAADPAHGTWWNLFGAGQAGPGWCVSLRNEGGKSFFHLRVDSPRDKLAWSHCFSAAEVSGKFGWMHVALVYDAARAGSGSWELFLNGASCGGVTNTVKPSDAQGFADFYLGGRTDAGGSFFGQVDLWRVSDEALPRGRFLNASLSSTVAYWPLDTATGGKLDLNNRAGENFALCVGKDGGVSGSAEQAVSQIQYSAVSRRGMPETRANMGSLSFEGGIGRRSLLVAPDLGLRCDLTNSFTVEGWLLKRGTPDERFWYLAGARDDSNGWMLSLRKEGGQVRFHLHVSDVSQGGRLQFERFFRNAGMADHVGWSHVALVYDHRRNGCGVWELYLDGVPQGEIRNPVAPDRSHGWRNFTLGGRVSLSNSFVGGMDCWRVSDAPLAPEQFLCHVPDAEARTAETAADDFRRFAHGKEVPVEAGRGEPALSVLRDGSWLCVATGRARGGRGTAQQVVSTVSSDKGVTWSPPVEVVSAKGTNELLSTCLVTPFDRIYVFYAEASGAGASNSACWYTFSDDGGATWSGERHRVPLWPHGAGPRRFKGLSKPVVSDGTMYVALTTQAPGSAFPEGDEGWIIASDNILSERNARRVHFKVLPEGGGGIRNPVFGPVQTGLHLVTTGSNELLCVYGTEGLSAPVQSVSRDGGCVWTVPERMTYGPGRREVMTDKAGVRLFGTREGRFVMCYRMPGLPQGRGGAPVFVSGGLLGDTGGVRWSEPELLMYDRTGSATVTCADMVEQEGRFWFMAEQSGVVRIQEPERGLLQSVWQQESRSEVCSNGLAAACVNASNTDLSFAVSPTFGCWSGGGLSVELWMVPSHAAMGETLFSTRRGRHGVRVGAANSKGQFLMRIELYDGDRQIVWHADPVVLRKDRLLHVVFVCDVVAGMVCGFVDGKFCDGYEIRGYGWGDVPAGLWTVAASERAKVSASVKQARLYERPLRTSEAVGNFRAGPVAGH